MKRNAVFGMLKTTGWLAALAVGAAVVQAQISIGPAGAGPFAFDTRPTVAEGWSTAPDDDGAAANVTTAAALDANMQTNRAANIVTELGESNSVNPPTQNALARWNSVNRYIQTRSTSVNNTKLMATLRNDSGSAISSVTIAYDYTVEVRAGSTIVEEIPGHRVYYSTTGEPNSWTVIPALSSVLTSTVNDAGRLTATLNLGSWPAGGMLYILWLDDNGSDDQTGPTEEGVYTIDNVLFTVATAEGPLSVINAALPLSLDLNEYAVANFTFQVSGSTPSYFWFFNGQLIAGANQATYSIPSANANHVGSYFCIASNTFGTITSRVASLGITPDDVKPAVLSVLGAGADKVRVVFTEAVNPATATNPANYTILLAAGGGAINVASITMVNTNTAELLLAQPRQYATDYVVTVRNVQDRALSPNTIFTQTELIPAEYNIQLFPVSHVWRYDRSNTDFGTAWRAPSFDDSVWPSGPGILGYDDTAATLADFAANGEALRTSFGALTGNVPTYYFRTTFTNTQPVAGLSLVAQGWIDDAAIFYINGVEAGRFVGGTAATPGVFVDPVTHTNLTITATDETPIKNIPLNPAALVQGVNHLAVEVHQNSATSSDIIMGVRLNLVIPVPLKITSQPVGTNMFEGGTLNLTVGYEGSLANFQWYKSNAPVAGATSATYSVNPATTDLTGDYYVVITNGISVVTSATVNVTVRLDDVRPFVTYAVMQTNGFNVNWGDACVVNIQFSERVNTNNLLNMGNYFIVRQGDATNNVLPIYEAAVDATGTNLTLICGTKQEATWVNYTLYIGNINDLAAAPNTMTRTNFFMHQRHFVVKSQTQAWKYNATGADLGTGWIAPAFNDSAWDQAYSPFVDESYINSIPNGWGAPSVYIPVGSTIPSYYYRTTFNLPTDPMGVRLQFEVWADDGCVIYLNGSEWRSNLNNNDNPDGRYYMTNGTEQVRFNTLAQSHTAGTPSQRAPLYPVNLRNGANTLAVSVHQSAADMSGATQDHAFALQIIATVPPLNQTVRPALLVQQGNITTNQGANVTLRAVGDGSLPLTATWRFNSTGTVQTVNVPAGTAATNIPNLISLVLNNVGAAQEGLYQLVLQNSAGSITSSVVNLTVLRPPVFLAQPVGTNVNAGATVTFSAPAEGSQPLRYQWFVGGSNRLFNETNATLTLLNVQPEQAGNYTVVVTNVMGAITSQVAVLTVISGQATPPSIPRSGLVYQGVGGNFSLQVPTQAGFTYRLQWNANIQDRNGWQNVAGASVSGDGSVRTLTDANPAGGRRFYRIAVD